MDGYINNDKTKDWQLYERGKKYNNSLKPNYYATVDTNIAFFSGDQWRNVQNNSMPTPVFNIIKRCVTFFVASLTSSKVAVNIKPLEYSDDVQDPLNADPQTQASFIATSEIENLFEKFKMDSKIRDALFDAGIMGDVAAHLYFDPTKKPYGGMFADTMGEICLELVDGTNVYFGNPNNHSIDAQPYIIVSGRDMVDNLKAEAMQYKNNQENLDNITEDKLYNEQAGDAGKIEIEGDEYGKALYLIVYRKDRKTGSITVSKCVESAYIYKDIDTGLTRYPVSWLQWEKQKNQYHGRAICTGIIPNQIFINRMFAMVMYNLMMTAFPKAVYDKDKINGTWTNEIGAAIPVHNLMPGDSIRNIAGYLEGGNMSSQIVQVIDLAIQHTKDTLGINDAMMGNVNPEQASGVSIAATVQQSVVPLENTRANLHQWIEDIGTILLDMMGTYYGMRPIVINTNGAKQVTQYDFSQLKNLYLNVGIDVGASSYWSEIASVQTLDNLLKQGLIDVISYLETLPDGYISNKQDLIDKLKAQQEQQMMQQQEQMMQQQPQQQQQPNNDKLYSEMEGFFNSLPPDVQDKLKSMPDDQMEQTVMQMMQDGGGQNG